jgi:hypothetical protein
MLTLYTFLWPLSDIQVKKKKKKKKKCSYYNETRVDGVKIIYELKLLFYMNTNLDSLDRHTDEQKTHRHYFEYMGYRHTDRQYVHCAGDEYGSWSDWICLFDVFPFNGYFQPFFLIIFWGTRNYFGGTSRLKNIDLWANANLPLNASQLKPLDFISK